RPAVDPLIALLEDPWPLQLPPELRDLGGYSSYSGPTYSVRIAAVKALLAIGPPAEEALRRDGVPHLTAGLQTVSLDVRLHTARALTLLGPRALPAATVLVPELR